jgi:hypothetical protein
LIDAQAAVALGDVCLAINDVRQEVALGRVDREAVSEVHRIDLFAVEGSAPHD